MTDEQEKLRISKVVASLNEVPAWHEFRKVVEYKIQKNLPTNVNKFEDGQATQIASQVIYCNGLQGALDVFDKAMKHVASSGES